MDRGEVLTPNAEDDEAVMASSGVLETQDVGDKWRGCVNVAQNLSAAERVVAFQRMRQKFETALASRLSPASVVHDGDEDVGEHQARKRNRILVDQALEGLIGNGLRVRMRPRGLREWLSALR